MRMIKNIVLGGAMLMGSAGAALAQCATPMMPIISWPADASIIQAKNNGADFNWKLENDFKKQVLNYNSGISPFVRGTASQIVEKFSDFDVQPEIFIKLSWSVGDAIVTTKPLTPGSSMSIAIMENGPFTSFVAKVADDLDINFDLVFVKGLNDSLKLLQQGKVDAGVMIMPDALTATDGGGVGSGAENSVKGAKIGFSTRESARTIPDMIGVNPEYLKKCRENVREIRDAILEMSETLSVEMHKPFGDSQLAIETSKIIANDVIGGLSNEEGYVAWKDAIIDTKASNAHFFDETNPRGFQVVMDETSQYLIDYAIIDIEAYVNSVDWSNEGVVAKDSIQTSVNSGKAKRELRKARRVGNIEDMTRISLEVFFDPKSSNFPASQYQDDYDMIADFMLTNPGAFLTVEAHVDASRYNSAKQKNEKPKILKIMALRAKELSMERAKSFSKGLVENGVDEKRILVEPLGFSDNKYKNPKSEQQWRENMRVVARLVSVSVEALEFVPQGAE